MKFKFDARAILKYLWQSISAVVALVLIIAAFIIGSRFGTSSNPVAVIPTNTTTQSDDATAPVEEVTEYTCSMHPNVRLPDKDALCPICKMGLIPVTTGPDDGTAILVMSTAALKLAEIETTTVIREFPQGSVRLVGKIDYDETRLATIAAYFPGRLEQLFVDYTGVMVQKHDHLAEIYSPDLIAAQEELRSSAQAVNHGTSTSEMIRSINRDKLAAARDKLRLWGLTTEQITTIESQDEVLEHLTIYSPIGGVVIEKLAVEGQYVNTGDPIYRVADLTHLWVRLNAYESQLPFLHYGQAVEFTSESFPGESFTGQISFIDRVVNEKTRTISVRVNVDNTDDRLKPGMYVRATASGPVSAQGLVFDNNLAGQWICPMHPEIVEDATGDCDLCGMPLVTAESLGLVNEIAADQEPPIVIPVSAALVTGRRAVVYIEVQGAEKPTFEGRVITLGPRAGDYYIVRDGLMVGEKIVTKGNFKIDSALQIQAKPSMMSQVDTPMEMPDESETTTPSDVDRYAVTPAFQAALTPLYNQYFAIYKALTLDDFETFKQATKQWHATINASNVPTLPEAAAQKTWAEIRSTLLTDEAQIDQLADIAAARALFETYANAIIKLDQQFGHAAESNHYIQYCPMAFSDQGASWLAPQEQIENPYFGDMMYSCGEVVTEIPATIAADTGGNK